MDASSSRGYQGYPYVNPHTYDAPSIDQATASRWANLPRRQICTTNPYVVYSDRTQVGQSTVEGREPSSSTSRMALPIKPEPNETPVVYIDLPEDSGSDVTQYREERHQTQVTQRREEPSSSSTQLPFKAEPDENPVVYIDLPDCSGSEVSQNRDESLNEPEFVQETIFYDPFENRRIDIEKPPGTVRSNSSWNSESDLDSVSDVPSRPPPPRPVRPRVLDLTSHTSGSSTPPISSISSTTSMFPPSLPDTYTRPLPESNLPTPLPLTGFPEPPPAYTEFEISTPVVEPPRLQPPRTQVILPGPPVGLPNLDRKYLKCHHCGMQVHTLVVREVGLITHISAIICLIICMLPIVFMIYCMDCLKNKSHFCPNCNKMIGFEYPLSGRKIVYLH